MVHKSIRALNLWNRKKWTNTDFVPWRAWSTSNSLGVGNGKYWSVAVTVTSTIFFTVRTIILIGKCFFFSYKQSICVVLLVFVNSIRSKILITWICIWKHYKSPTSTLPNLINAKIRHSLVGICLLSLCISFIMLIHRFSCTTQSSWWCL